MQPLQASLFAGRLLRREFDRGVCRCWSFDSSFLFHHHRRHRRQVGARDSIGFPKKVRLPTHPDNLWADELTAQPHNPVEGCPQAGRQSPIKGWLVDVCHGLMSSGTLHISTYSNQGGSYPMLKENSTTEAVPLLWYQRYLKWLCISFIGM